MPLIQVTEPERAQLAFIVRRYLNDLRHTMRLAALGLGPTTQPLVVPPHVMDELRDMNELLVKLESDPQETPTV